MNKNVFLFISSCIIFGNFAKASIPVETTGHTAQNEQITKSLGNTSSCSHPLIDFSKEARSAMRVAVFYTLVWCTYHANNWAWERFFGKVASKDEARDFWYDCLILAIVIELASKAEGDWSVFTERAKQDPLVS